MESGMLVGAFGDGRTKQEAIENYAKRISLGRLCFDPFDQLKRKEIAVPRLIEK